MGESDTISGDLATSSLNLLSGSQSHRASPEDEEYLLSGQNVWTSADMDSYSGRLSTALKVFSSQDCDALITCQSQFT